MYGRMIYYLDEKSKIAVEAFLKASNKKVINYQELKQITKVFDIPVLGKAIQSLMGIKKIDIGVIVVATGARSFVPEGLYGYDGKHVITQLEMEKILKEGLEPGLKNIVMIQCVGSRDFRFYPFCSGYCCMHSIKEAIIAHEHEPETTSTIFGMDIRAVSKGFEEYKIRGGNHSNITYVRGRVSEIMEGSNNNPVVIYEDTSRRQVKSEEFDMVILATACAPTRGIIGLAKIFGVELDEYNFIRTRPVSPVDTTTPGIFVCGCAESPMDVPESVAQASSAAQRAAEIAIPLASEKEKAVA